MNWQVNVHGYDERMSVIVKSVFVGGLEEINAAIKAAATQGGVKYVLTHMNLCESNIDHGRIG